MKYGVWSIFCDFTAETSVLDGLELSLQNKLFGNKHMLVVPFYGKMIKNTILQMYTRNVPKSHKLWFLSELGDFTTKSQS